MAALADYNYTTDYAVFAISSEAELSKLPNTSRGGTDELAGLNHPIKGGVAYTTDGNLDVYTLDGSGAWNKREIGGGGGGAADVTENLFDKTQLIEGMSYNWQHNWVASEGLASYFIPVTPGDIILMRGAKNWGTSGDSVFVDSNKVWISNVTSRNSSGGLIDPLAKTAPSNAAYVCATVYVGDADYERFWDRDTLDVRIWS